MTGAGEVARTASRRAARLFRAEKYHFRGDDQVALWVAESRTVKVPFTDQEASNG